MRLRHTSLVGFCMATVMAHALAQQTTQDKIKTLDQEKQLEVARKAKADAELDRILAERKLKQAIDESVDLAKARQQKADAEKLAVESENNLKRALDAATVDLINRKTKAEAEKQSLTLDKEVAEAEAALARLPDELAEKAITSRTKRRAAEIGEDFVLVDALKKSLGEPPEIGKDGALTLNDSKGGFLLRNRVATVDAMQDMAQRLCQRLKDANVVNAYMTTDGFEAKVFNAEYFGQELAAQLTLANVAEQTMSNIQPAAVPAAIAGLTAARYLVGGITELSKVFRSDFDAAVSESTSRAALVQSMTAAQCPSVIKISNLEQMLRLTAGSRISSLHDNLYKIGRTVDAYGAKTQAFETQIADDEKVMEAERKKLAKLTEEYEKLKQEAQRKGDRAPDKSNELNQSEAKLDQLAGLLDTGKRGLASLKLLQKDVDRLRTFLESLKSRSNEVADHLVWTGFSPYATTPRVALIVTAQDTQIAKDGTFTGKKLSALGSIEILYVASVPSTGAVMASGALYETRALSTIDLTKSEKAGGVFAPAPTPNSDGRQ